jgi:hypothetical protein
MGIENKITCTLADYNWGDRLERMESSENAEGAAPARLTELEEILADAPEPGDAKKTTDSSADATGALAKWETYVTGIEDDIEKYCNDKFILYNSFRKVSRAFDETTGWKLVYARTDGTTYTLKTGFDYQSVAEKDVTEDAGKIIAEKEIAEAAGVEYLYVQFPYRVDEEGTQNPWGADAYENANTDSLLEQIREASVEAIDLRKELTERGWDNDSGFYETDGHWTTRSGFMSAGIVASYLNEMGYNYSDKYFDETNYATQSYSVNNSSVDEQVEIFIPQFDTAFTVMDAYRGEYYSGTFAEACLDMTKADTDEYSTVLTAYSASRIRNSYLFEYSNETETENDKRILISSDSFSWHLTPYLALDTAIIDYVYKMTPEQLEYYIDTLEPDIVIVMDRM